MDPAALLAIPAVKKVLDVVRYVTVERDVMKTVYAVGAWVVGFGIVQLVAASSLAAGVGLEGLNLADAILAGIALGSTASVVHDFSHRTPVEGHPDYPPAVVVNVPEGSGTARSDGG